MLVIDACWQVLGRRFRAAPIDVDVLVSAALGSATHCSHDVASLLDLKFGCWGLLGHVDGVLTRFAKRGR